MGTKGKKKRIKNTLSDVGTNIKQRVVREKADDEQIILDTARTCNIETSDDNQYVTSETSLNDIVCPNCGRYLNLTEVGEKTRCGDCNSRIKITKVKGNRKLVKGEVADDPTTKERKNSSRKTKTKKTGYRVWRACVMGWKYLKAGLVMYVNPATTAFNVTTMGTSMMNQKDGNDRNKYYYPIYKT